MVIFTKIAQRENILIYGNLLRSFYNKFEIKSLVQFQNTNLSNFNLSHFLLLVLVT